MYFHSSKTARPLIADFLACFGYIDTHVATSSVPYYLSDGELFKTFTVVNAILLILEMGIINPPFQN